MNKKVHLLIPILFLSVIMVGCGISNDSDVKTKTASSFVIEQTDKEKANMILPGSFPGTSGQINFQAEVKVVSKGSNSSTILKGAKYDYLNEWVVDYVYDEVWDQLSFDLGLMGQCAISNNTIQYKGKLKFDLSTVDKDGNFNVKVVNPFSKVDKLYMVCINQFGTQTIPAEGFSKIDASIFAKGKITNITEHGATISFSDSYIYNTGFYKTLSKPMVLKIKRK